MQWLAAACTRPLLQFELVGEVQSLLQRVHATGGGPGGDDLQCRYGAQAHAATAAMQGHPQVRLLHALHCTAVVTMS